MRENFLKNNTQLNVHGYNPKVNNFCKMMYMYSCMCHQRRRIYQYISNISFVCHSLMIYFTSSCVKMNFEKNEIWYWRQSVKQLNRKKDYVIHYTCSISFKENDNVSIINFHESRKFAKKMNQILTKML